MSALEGHIRLYLSVKEEEIPIAIHENASVAELKERVLVLCPGQLEFYSRLLAVCPGQLTLWHNDEELDTSKTLWGYGIRDESVVKVSHHEEIENRYRRIRKVGKGTFGTVYKACDKLTNAAVAMKRVSHHMDEGVAYSAIREVAALQELDHPNVVKLLDIVNEPNKMYLVIEYVDQDLSRYLDSRTTPLPPATRRTFMHQLLSGMEYCHARRIFHRDLKPQNILISSDCKQLKIADFGLARDFQYPMQTYTQETVTLWYRAPELLLGALKYTPEIDIWSIGCIFAEMAQNKPLFMGDCEIGALYLIFQFLGTPDPSVWKNVESLPHHNHSFPKWKPVDISARLPFEPLAVHLFQRMLCYDPQLRITPSQALAHPYFNVRSEPLSEQQHMVLAP
eukprot:TRINITY_DN1288_c0_g1_i1.p1 TRINITY_DN1288_c0_g1~~TRINITY_DN1288_c0_g1_i1.p1  ORF type:complete len:394 (+),score=100.21 TRINITY_DN1288_c0_g1_i1:36-1217(+)